jgi:hypothetical protein
MDAFASAIGWAVADAVRDGVGGLLGVEEGPQRGLEYHDDRHRFGRHDWDDHDDHRDEDDPWRDDDRLPIPSKPARRTNSRWKEAVRAAMQTGLWWLRQQPTKRPVLTTTLVALAAGSAAFVAGPTLVACVSVVASVVGLLMTAETPTTAAGLIADG